MIGFMKSKRGVSPLIATVLLIAFAVALGAVVMNWGRTYVENTASNAADKSDTEIKCSMDVRLEVPEIDDIEQLCYCNGSNPSYMQFIIENTGLVDIADLQIQIIGKQNIYSNTSFLNRTMPKAELVKGKMYYDPTITGVLEQVRFVPAIKHGSKVEPCSGRALVKGAGSINNCTTCSYT